MSRTETSVSHTQEKDTEVQNLQFPLSFTKYVTISQNSSSLDFTGKYITLFKLDKVWAAWLNNSIAMQRDIHNVANEQNS